MESNSELPTAEPLIVVGVGASAGGLEAFQELLRGLDVAQDIAIVFLYPEKGDEILLANHLSQSTSLPVIAVSGRKKLKPGSIYVCPPAKLPELKNGTLRIRKPENNEHLKTPIDHLLKSIASDQGGRSIGVILSGTGSDGTLGLKAISDAGGMTFAQSAESAEYDSMPRSAATTGVADHVLAPNDIAAELKKYAKYLAAILNDGSVASSVRQIHEAIPVVARLLMEATNHNFQHYKQNSLTRRIRRRMQVLKLENVDTYVKLLAEDPEEPHRLFRELLISVTAFFRDPDAFDSLSKVVIPKIFANRKREDVVRFWVPGCATGEEAFTLAMLCLEAMDSIDAPPEVQIFATDIDERALKTGRLGVYPIGIEEDLSEQHLKRFFIKRGKKYQIVKEVRELVLFSAHNLISDPPFSRLDLISCRNLLIYLGPHLQQKLIPLFHYALRPSGFLMLGPSENILSHGELFSIIDAKYRISQRKGTGIDATAALTLVDGGMNAIASDRNPPSTSPSVVEDDLMRVMQRIVLDEFAPKSVIVDDDGKIICASADMHKYLSVGSGNFHNNIIKMARAGLRIGLRATLQEAKAKRRRIVRDDLSIRVDGQLQRVMLTVQPMPRVGSDAELFMIVFHDCGLPLTQSKKVEEASDSAISQNVRDETHRADTIIEYLERELSSTRADLEMSIQEYETTNQQLKLSNEELYSLNEELQSANEELQASKEEIKAGIISIEKAHSDLENLFQSTQIATLFLDSNDRLVRFTPAACEIYNLISTDVGRPLGHITHKAMDMPTIPNLAEITLANNSIEEEFQSRKGRWYLRRVLPYFHNGRTEGLILTFIDITDRKRALIRLATMHRVTQIVASAPSMESFFPEVLHAIIENLNAAYCAIWLVDSESKVLRCTEAISDPNKPGVDRFADQSRHMLFEPGSGLPGRVWLAGETHWIEKVDADTDFLRQELAAESGLTSGVALPIVIGSTVYGVIEIFTVARLDRDEAFVDMLQSVGNEIGQFIVRNRLAEKLRDEEARKSAILDVALDAIVTMNVEGRIVDFNPAAERVFGFTRKEAQGQLLSETIIPEEFRESHVAGLSRYMESGTANVLGRRLELMAMRKDGSVFPIEIAINSTTNRDGTPFFTAHMRDITEQKQFVQTIVNRDNRITALLNSTAEGIYGMDLDGNCTFANDSSARLLGFQNPDELVGRKMHDLIHHTTPSGQPYPVEECKIHRAFRLGEAVHVDDEFYWRADGTSFDVEYWSYPQIQDGKVVGCVVSFLDVSERKKLASDLVDREAHLRRVIDNMLGFVGVLDLEGVLREVNRTALIAGRLTREEVIGKPFWECYWWSHDERLVQQLKAAIATAAQGDVVRYDVEVRMAGDTRLAIDFMLAPVKDTDGNITHLIPSGVDISERKIAELEVQQRVNQLNLALESGRMGLWEWEIAADHVTWSSQLYETFGYNDETFNRSHSGFLSVIHPDDRPKLELMIQSAPKASSASHEVEFRVIRGDTGETVWNHSRGTVRRGMDGQPNAILSVSVDITERKQRELMLAFLADLQSHLTGFSSAEAIIGEASLRVTQYLKLSHFMLVKIDKDAMQATVEFDHCSDGSSSLLGIYDMVEFANEDERRQLSLGLPMVVNDTAGSTRSASFIENFSKLNIGAILNAPSSRDQRLRFMLSATKQHAHNWREDEIQLMRELANILRLKLDRAHAETALRESEVKFRDLADNISQFAWMTDSKGSIFWYNQRWFDFTGTTLDEMRDWGWKSVQHPDHLERVVRHWQECLASGTVWEDTFPLRSKEGEYRWFLSRAQPIRDDLGSIVRWFGTNTDITETKQAEEALRASQEQLRLGVEVAKFALARIDYERDRIYLSQQAAQLYGLGQEEIVLSRSQVHATFHPDDRQGLMDSIERCLDPSNDGDLSLEHRVVMPDGEIRWLDVRERISFDSSFDPPRPQYGILAAQDITEEKRWETELADRESHLRRVINNQLGLVGVIDQDGILVEMDDRSISIAGLTREDVIGKHFAECAWWKYDESISKKMRESMNKAFAGERVRFDVALYAQDNKRLMIDFMITPVRDADGSITYLIPSGIDISERKLAEVQLADSKERLSMAMASARMGSYEWELDSDVVIWDDQHLTITGLTREEATGAEFLKRIHADDAEANQKAIENTIEGKCDYDTEFRFIRPDGNIRWFAARGKIIEPEGDRPRRFVGLNWDITEEKEQAQRIRKSEECLRAAAEAANRSKSEFLANMSHEIRTPMTAILGYTDLVVEKINDDETMQHVQTIRRNGDYLLQIINDILDLSKIEAGKFEINREVFAPHALIEDVRSIMEVRARENDNQLEVEYRGLIPNQIESDPKRLKQILINLVGNAIKFTPSGRVKIEVSFSQEAQRLRFDVIDSGIGISEEQQKQLFQPFSQGDGTMNRVFGGTGLGLAISKRLTEMLNGEIFVVSELGKGSTFTVIITTGAPRNLVWVSPESEANKGSIDLPTEPVKLSCHVLVVDDRRDIRFLSRKFLSDAGAQVSEAEDGEIALKLVTQAMSAGKGFDLILLDMQMPRLDGYQTATALRKMGYRCPIIALTADAMQGDMSRCLDSGCNDYLSKPINRNRLLALVKQFTS